MPSGCGNDGRFQDASLPEEWEGPAQPSRPQGARARDRVATTSKALRAPKPSTPGSIERNAVDRLLFDTVRPRRLYAVANRRLYQFSADGWERLGPADLPLACSLAESSDGRLLAPSFEGILLSVDGGVTWKRSPEPKDVFFRVVSPTGAPETLIASGGRGLWRSNDGGRSWKPASRSISGFVVREVAVAEDGTLFSSPGGEGVMRSRDQGATWERAVRGLGPDSNSNPALAVDPRHPEIVWAGAGEMYAVVTDGLYFSRDGGTTRSPAFSVGPVRGRAG